jgi:hypothetical protein
MYIQAISARGLAGLKPFHASGLDRRVRVAGPPRARTALADALTLALCPFSSDDLMAAAGALGWGEVEVVGEDLPEEVVISRPHAALRLLAPPERPSQPPGIRVDLTVAMDPPQLEALRKAAIREPALGPALVGGTPLEFSVGWVFTRDGSVGSPSLLGARLGAVVVRPGEKPDWINPILRGLGGRFLRRRPGAIPLEVIDAADRSPEPEVRAALRALRSDLEGSPFRLGRLELLRDEEGQLEAAFGDELVPLRAMGPEAAEALGLAAAVHLHDSEILALEAPLAMAERRDAWLRWMTLQVEADASPLEQIWLFGAGGADALTPEQS